MNKKMIIFAILICVFLVFGYIFDFSTLFKSLLEYVSDTGIVGQIIYGLVYIIATIVFIPGSILTLGAGFIFGVVKGSIIVSISSTLGAGLAFLIGRYVARDWVMKKIANNKNFKAIDKTVNKNGWKIIGLLRLSPLLPFSLSNYAFGLTGISFKGYFFSSWIGMLPLTIMYVYIGSVAGNIANLNPTDNQTPLKWIFFIGGLLLTIIVSIYVSIIAKNAVTKMNN